MKYLAGLLGIALCLVPTAHAAEAASAATAPREIVLVRHGHYDKDPAIDEAIGPPLSSLGVAQAYLAGARLRGEDSAFDALWVSPMQRARDTAAAIGAELPAPGFRIDAELAECTPPTHHAQVMAEIDPAHAAACKARLDRVFARHFAAGPAQPRRELLVCHGNVIRYLVTRALGVDGMAWLEMSVGHASITRIRVQPDGRYKVIAVGDVGHIPAVLRSGASGDAARRLALPPLQLIPTGAAELRR